MGRNSEKRKRRNLEAKAERQAKRAKLKATTVPAAPTEPARPRWPTDTVIADAAVWEEGKETLTGSLFRVSAAVSRGPDLDDAAQEIAAVIDADTVTLLELDDAKLRALGSYTRAPSTRSPLFPRGDEALVQHALSSGETLVVDDAVRDDAFVSAFGHQPNTGSLMGTPLRYRDETWGLLLITRREATGFPDLTRRLVENLAAQVGHDVMQSRAFFEAVTDPLTGLVSRQGFQFLLRREVQRARRGEGDLALVLCDVDDLDGYSELHGRHAGDEVLRQVAVRLAHEIRGADLAVRFGGDEFVLLLPGLGLEEAVEVCHRIHRGLRDRALDVPSGGPTLSLGVAALDLEDTDGLSLLSRTDRALGAAKGEGPGRIAVVEPSTL